MNNTQMALSLVTDPRSVFVSIKDRNSFWFPLFFVVLSTALAVAYYYSRVDFEWFLENMMHSGPAGLNGGSGSPENTPEIMSRNVLMWVSVTMVIVGLPLIRLAESLYYFLAGRISGSGIQFSQWFSLICWSSLPTALIVIVSVIMLVMHPSGQVTQESLNVLSLNELVFHVSENSKWFTLLSTLTVLHPWVWWLTAVGIQSWSSRSLLYSLIFSLLPWVLFYGGWALLIAAQASD